MSVILLILGILVAGAGLATVGFGIPINEFSLGTTLIIAGTTAFMGGLILIGLATVVSELNRLGEAVRGRPAVRPTPVTEAPVEPVAATTAAAAGPRPAPPQVPLAARAKGEAPAEARPAAPTAVEVSAAAIERLRSSIPRAERAKPEPAVVAEVDEVPLSPNGSALAAQQARPVDSAGEPRAAPPPAARSGDAAAVDALKASRLDFLFRSKPARPAPSENFDSFWPAEDKAAKSAPRQAEPRFEGAAKPAPAAAPPPEESYVEPAPAAEPRTAAILKSGVVDGMAYTLYADGSIEAKLPHGTVRFGSIAELRAHIESNS